MIVNDCICHLVKLFLKLRLKKYYIIILNI